MRLMLSNGVSVTPAFLVPGSVFLKGSFYQGTLVYVLMATILTFPLSTPLCSFSSYGKAKEAKTQLDLAIDQMLR